MDLAQQLSHRRLHTRPLHLRAIHNLTKCHLLPHSTSIPPQSPYLIISLLLKLCGLLRLLKTQLPITEIWKLRGIQSFPRETPAVTPPVCCMPTGLTCCRYRTPGEVEDTRFHSLSIHWPASCEQHHHHSFPHATSSGGNQASLETSLSHYYWTRIQSPWVHHAGSRPSKAGVHLPPNSSRNIPPSVRWKILEKELHHQRRNLTSA